MDNQTCINYDDSTSFPHSCFVNVFEEYAASMLFLILTIICIILGMLQKTHVNIFRKILNAFTTSHEDASPASNEIEIETV